MIAAIELSKTIDLQTLTMIFLALLLAISGFAQRGGRRAEAGFPILCPNKVEEIWPKLEELLRRLEESASDQEEARRLCGDLRLLMERIDGRLGNDKEVSKIRLKTILDAIDRLEKLLSD
jgi:hypothetical protein